MHLSNSTPNATRRHGRLGIHSLASLAMLVATAASCDKETPKVEPKNAPPPSASAAPPPVPEAPRKVQLAVDDTAAFVSGERVDLAAPDPKGRFATVLGSKLVSGQDLTLEAARATKFPKVALVVAAVAKAGAKSLVIHTPKRDQVMADIPVSLRAKWDGCSAVGFIGKDSGIIAQTAGGAGALRFTRGLAGPDLTRGSEGIKKLAGACESPLWLVSAEEPVTWGLVADLILAVAGGEEGGAPAKAREVALLSTPPSSGHKVEAE